MAAKKIPSSIINFSSSEIQPTGPELWLSAWVKMITEKREQIWHACGTTVTEELCCSILTSWSYLRGEGFKPQYITLPDLPRWWFSLVRGSALWLPLYAMGSGAGPIWTIYRSALKSSRERNSALWITDQLSWWFLIRKDAVFLNKD